MTAPESYVLRYDADCSSWEAYKLAVKELVARRGLRLVATPPGLLGRRKSALAFGIDSHAIAEPALVPLLDCFRQVKKKPVDTGVDAVPLASFTRRARRSFSRPASGAAFDVYRDETVLPVLVQRGLFEARDPGRRRGKKYSRTELGESADNELEEWLRVGRQRLPEWLKEDPARALAYAGGAGTTILLLDQVFMVELDRLRVFAAEQAAGHPPWVPGGPVDSGPIEPGPGESDLGALDAGSLDFGGLDFGGLDFGGADFGGLDFGGGGGDGGGGGGGNGGGG